MIGDLKLTQEAEEYISKSTKGEIEFQKCDVSSWEDLHGLITASVEKFGQVRLLFTRTKCLMSILLTSGFEVPDVYAPIGKHCISLQPKLR